MFLTHLLTMQHTTAVSTMIRNASPAETHIRMIAKRETWALLRIKLCVVDEAKLYGVVSSMLFRESEYEKLP